MATKKTIANLKQPESITAKLEQIAYDYRNDMEIAIDNLNWVLENNLTELVEEFGTKAVQASIDGIEDSLYIEFAPKDCLSRRS